MKQMTRTKYGICGITCEFNLAEIWSLSHMRDRLKKFLESEDAHIFPVEDLQMLENFFNRILKGAPEMDSVDIFDPLPPEESKEDIE